MKVTFGAATVTSGLVGAVVTVNEEAPVLPVVPVVPVALVVVDPVLLVVDVSVLPDPPQPMMIHNANSGTMATNGFFFMSSSLIR